MTSETLRKASEIWPWPDSMDALVAAPDHHTLLMENERVRVVRTRIPPGQIVPVHTHRWPGVLFIVAWSDLIRRDPQGNVLLDTRQTPDKPSLNVPLSQEPLPPHTIENVGGMEFNAVQVEMKDATVGDRHALKFRRMPDLYAIVRLAPDASVPDWATKADFTSITRTSDELSVVCTAGNIPSDVDAGLRWTCFKLEGPFPFSQTGVLLSFIEPLSNNGIPIFTVSTYDTDYVLVPNDHTLQALDLLRDAGHEPVME
jgi:uncharacterized protein